MKKGDFFRKKEIDLSKISIFILTEEGKSRLKLYAKKSLKIILLFCALLFIAFIIWSFNASKFNKRKQICDNLVSAFIFEEKETLRLKEVAKQNEFSKKHGMLQVKGREYLNYSPHSITRNDRVVARRSIPECNTVYKNGFDNQ